MARQVGNNGRSKSTSRARDVTKGARMLELVASGHTVTSAARELAISRKHASELYNRELQSAMNSNAELRQHLLAQDLETLRLLIQAHMPAATGAVWAEVEDEFDGEGRRVLLIARPDAGSAKIVLGALDRRAKLLGLDAAVRVEVSQARVAEVVDGIVATLDNATEDDLAEVLEIDTFAADAG